MKSFHIKHLVSCFLLLLLFNNIIAQEKKGKENFLYSIAGHCH